MSVYQCQGYQICYDNFPIGFWNCSGGLVFFVFHFT